MAATLADGIFKCILLNENVRIPLNFVPEAPIYNNPGICSDNGLVPKRWQAIIWTNVDPIHWRIYAVLGRDELT